MSEEWTNVQIMECSSESGATVTVFIQSNGELERCVLGNGRRVDFNRDGTFTIPESQTVLSVMAF
ncbi:MAG: MHC class I heavy chain [Rhodobacteraceae bacterium]|nr:MHC class I heavy chain [Paracoccaceae bacterium]